MYIFILSVYNVIMQCDSEGRYLPLVPYPLIPGITQYSSTVYIGIGMVFVFSPYISSYTFSFKSIQLLMTLQHI